MGGGSGSTGLGEKGWGFADGDMRSSTSEACTPGSSFSTPGPSHLGCSVGHGEMADMFLGPLSSPESPHQDIPSRSEVPPVGSQADPVSDETLVSEELAAMILERHDSKNAEDTC